MSKIEAVRCPSCGAPLKTLNLFQTCNYCGTFIMITHSENTYNENTLQVKTGYSSYFHIDYFYRDVKWQE